MKELADRMAVSPETVTRILSENGNPTLSTMVNIAQALDVKVYELFDDFNEDMLVRGYLEVGDKIYRISNFNDLKTIYNKLGSK